MIAVIVLFAVLLGFIQEYRAERALEALREMAAPIGHAIRGGVELAVPARKLVPGDLIVLRAGDRVPADARVTVAINLAIDEAALTGKSGPRRSPRHISTLPICLSAIAPTWPMPAR